MTVWMVGAGPGDPSLLTVAAADLLRRAGAVVYDRPSSGPVLDLAPASAELVAVGRGPGRVALQTAAVTERLVDLAARHEVVVRLKSGDPFLISRGSEEVLALAARGVDVRAVPGVSAALAAPALAGIPLTLRPLTVTATVVAGNDDPDQAAVDWEALARLGGTIVVLTGRSRIRRILATLADAGLAGDTPVAAVSAAGRAGQRCLRGTVAAPPQPVLPPPVTYVIGAVAGNHVAGDRVGVVDGAISEAHP